MIRYGVNPIGWINDGDPTPGIAQRIIENALREAA